MRKRTCLILFALATLLAAVPARAQSPVPLGIAVKFGGGVARDGWVPNGLLSVDVGPYQGFVELFEADGWQQINIGANLLVFDLPLPLLRPYGGGGAGFTRNVSNGSADGRFMFDGLLGADFKAIPGGFTLFAQMKYIYSMGSGPNIRDVVFQGGLTLRMGL